MLVMKKQSSCSGSLWMNPQLICHSVNSGMQDKLFSFPCKDQKFSFPVILIQLCRIIPRGGSES